MITSSVRRSIVNVVITFFLVVLVGCSGSTAGGGSATNKLDGVYHGVTGGPITLTIKEGKATLQVGNESKTLDYKVDGNKLTILDPKEGDAVFTINDDGTLNSELGVMTKKPM